MRVLKETKAIVRWYFDEGRVEGVPFYCDPTRIGAFAVAPDELAAGAAAAIFRLFVTLSMYQALRDVVIIRQQRSLPRTSMRVVADVATVKRSIARHACPTLGSVEAFEEGCDVAKDGDNVDCGTCPGVACHVKDATRVFNRMGDMGKLPTSAWLRLWRGGGVRSLLDDVCRDEPSPAKRAALLVERFAAVHRVGRKLATMFVSALSTPALAPGLTPWFPEIDGNELVVVDTNVARAVDALRAPGSPKTYDARERWVREQAAKLDLRVLRPDLPVHSPRLVQEALYAFCSKSNRVARRDGCAGRATPCASCVPTVCPFSASRAPDHRDLRATRERGRPPAPRGEVARAGTVKRRVTVPAARERERRPARAPGAPRRARNALRANTVPARVVLASAQPLGFQRDKDEAPEVMTLGAPLTGSVHEVRERLEMAPQA